MDLVKKLEEAFWRNSLEDHTQEQQLEDALKKVTSYIEIGGGLAVVSDLISQKSYIYTSQFDLFPDIKAHKIQVIDSIWEEEIFQQIHKDDIWERHLLEYEFFHYLLEQDIDKRLDFASQCRLRVLDGSGNYQFINHQTSYLKMNPKGDLWLVLCLYNYNFQPNVHSLGIQGRIINKKNGDMVKVKTYAHTLNLLSQREIEVLTFIEKGFLSKEIAHQLQISINTVNRHRQNILEKLKVNNSMEAIQRMKSLEWSHTPEMLV